MSDARRFEQLEEENRRLKSCLRTKRFDNAILNRAAALRVPAPACAAVLRSWQDEAVA
jgi:hypothetical protein